MSIRCARVRGERLSPLCLLVVLVCLLPASACSGSEKPTYLALGDSFATGARRLQAEPGYVAALLLLPARQTKNDMRSVSEAVVGETTTSVHDRRRPARQSPGRAAIPQPGQRPHERRLRHNHRHRHQRHPRLVLAGQPCAPADRAQRPGLRLPPPTPPSTRPTQNLTAILRAVRVAAGPDVKMFVLNCFNSYSGTGKPSKRREDMLLPAAQPEDQPPSPLSPTSMRRSSTPSTPSRAKATS